MTPRRQPKLSLDDAQQVEAVQGALRRGYLTAANQLSQVVPSHPRHRLRSSAWAFSVDTELDLARRVFPMGSPGLRPSHGLQGDGGTAGMCGSVLQAGVGRGSAPAAAPWAFGVGGF